VARLVSLSPQFLVDDLDVSTAFYREKLGFSIDFVYEGFYAGVSRDGLGIHLKCAPKVTEDRENRKSNEHLDAYVGLEGIEDLYAEYQRADVTIVRNLEERPWGVKDFYVEDPDGYIVGFSEMLA
jgi:catechol 2,3-dioxygenase-like lactoylglutathione lyase family enzyme